MPIDAVRVIHGVADVLEADPADVADQHSDAPLVNEGEPWHQAGHAAAPKMGRKR